MILDQLWENMKFAILQALKRPLLSVTIVACLALGIGPNLAIFSLINTVLIAPVNIEDADQLRSISKERVASGSNESGAFSFPEYLRLLRHLAGKQEFIGENKTSSIVYVENNAFDAAVSVVSNNYFDLLRAEAIHGRTFTPEFDFIPGGIPEIVLSHRFWERQFDSRPGIVGTTVNLNASLADYEIIGVLPADFVGTSNYLLSDIYVPYEMAPDVFPQDPAILDLEGRNINFFYTRIESEQESLRLQEDLNSFASEMIEFSSNYEGLRFLVDQPKDLVKLILPASISAPISIGLLFLVGLILLLASSSVATLILSRASERRNEIAVRIASGASISVVVRQLLTEGFIFTICAAIVGWIMALWFAEVVPDLLENLLPDLPISLTVSDLIMDYRVLAYGLLLIIISTVITSLLPALQVSKGDLVSGLKDDLDQASSQQSTNRLRQFFLIIQFALCTIVLIVGALSYQSVRQSAELDLGFSYDSMLTFTYTPAQIGYLGEQAKEFSYGLVEVIKETEGVRQAAMSSNHHPFSVFNLLNTRTITPVLESGESGPMIGTRIADIGLDFFDAMEVDVLSGRPFNLDDLEKPRRDSLVLNEAMALEIWGITDVLGHQFLAGDSSLEAVGIVENYYSGSFSEQTPRIYYPIRQDRYDDQIYITIQTDGLSDALIQDLCNSIGNYHERLLLDNLSPISVAIANALGPLRMISVFSAILGGLALLLTLISI